MGSFLAQHSLNGHTLGRSEKATNQPFLMIDAPVSIISSSVPSLAQRREIVEQQPWVEHRSEGQQEPS